MEMPTLPIVVGVFLFGLWLYRRARDAPQSPLAWREPPAKMRHIGVGMTMTTREPHGFVRVVGESFYQDTLQAFAAIIDAGCVFTVMLVPELTNQDDPNAVAVKTEGNATVGYLPREIAKSYQKRLLQQPDVVRCPAKLSGVEGGKNEIGIVLDFGNVQRLKTSNTQRDA
jgi:hypothetical protein